MEVVRLILNWNADTERVSLERVKTALKLASRAGYIDIVQCLVEYGTAVNTLTSVHRVTLALTSALNQAIENHADVAAFLLDNGADFNVSSSTHASVWIHACSRGSPAMVRLLLARGADLSTIDKSGWSPLRAALQNSEVLKLLLEHGANPTLDPAATGYTPLMIAAGRVDVNVVRLLLEHGADVTQVNWEGKSVLGQNPEFNEVRELCQTDRKPVLK